MRLLCTAMAALILAAPSAAAAQEVPHTHSFKALPETTVTGVIESVNDEGSSTCEVCQGCADCVGTHLVIRKGPDRIEVHLAPAWFLECSGFVFDAGDVVTVTGMRIDVGRRHGIAAREVRRADEVMKFRDAYGLPLWRRELTEP